MKLSSLLDSVNIPCPENLDLEVTDICNDSRKAKSGSLFVCVKGYASDGHKFASKAYENGCRIFAAEDQIDLPRDAVIVYTEDTRKFLAKVSAAFYDFPAKKMTVIGITGTKGKTSITYILKSILEKAGHKVGIMGTVGIIYGDTKIQSPNSTPESLVIHKTLEDMRLSGVDIVIMEATSQGFKLHRTYGLNFDIGIYTNISPDHIGENEHADFEEYKGYKKVLFSQSSAIYANADCPHLEYLSEGCTSPIKTFGFGENATLRCTEETYGRDETGLFTKFVCGNEEYKIYTPGKFSVYNAMSAISAAKHLGVDYKFIKEGLEETLVEGRMEAIALSSGATAIIDYAHNELSVENLFAALKPYCPKRIITVFGCGGNRSKLRRYAMGEIIAKNSTLSVVTSDNPRDEKLEDIIADIFVGINKTEGKSVVIHDRKEAIEYAVKNAEDGDYILVVGKGHQHYEEIKGVHYPFDERAIILSAEESLRGN